MLIFIDDSGDPGFKVSQGSTPIFVICLVCFEDNLEAEKTAIAIKDLRRRLKWSDKAEFKFNKTRSDVKVQFLSAVVPYNFKIRAIIFQKELLYSQHLQENKDDFYRFAIKTALQGSKQVIKGANIKLDGHGDRQFRQEFETYLRRELKNRQGQPIYSKLAFVKSSQNNVLIQLADLCAGAINRSYNINKTDSKLYLNIIKPKIVDLWEFK